MLGYSYVVLREKTTQKEICSSLSQSSALRFCFVEFSERIFITNSQRLVKTKIKQLSLDIGKTILHVLVTLIVGRRGLNAR